MIAVSGGAVACFCFQKKAPSPFSLEIMEVEGGYGYTIYYESEEYIWQPFIPAIEGVSAFQSEKEAKSVGELVVKRLEQNEHPAISKEDLLKLKISW